MDVTDDEITPLGIGRHPGYDIGGHLNPVPALVLLLLPFLFPQEAIRFATTARSVLMMSPEVIQGESLRSCRMKRVAMR